MRIYIATIQIFFNIIGMCFESIRMSSQSFLMYFDRMQMSSESIPSHFVGKRSYFESI